jgi:hypothetical protein
MTGQTVFKPTSPKRPCTCTGMPGFVGDDRRRLVGTVWRCDACGRDWTWSVVRGSGANGPGYWWAPESTRSQKRREKRAQRHLG